MKNLRICLTLLALVLLAAAGNAQSTFTLEQVLSAPFPTELSVSPHGNRLAWFYNEQGRRNVWVAEGPQFTARPVTHFSADDGQALTQLVWSRDGETLVFVRGEGKNSEGEFPNPTNDPAGTEQAIWAVSFAGELPRKLGNGSSADVSTTGQVVFVSDGQIWVVPLSGSAPAQQFFKARGKNGGPTWSPDGKSVAFVSDRGEHSFIALYRPASNTLRYISPSVDRDHSPLWSPDGKQIAFIRQPGRGGDPPAAGAILLPPGRTILQFRGRSG